MHNPLSTGKKGRLFSQEPQRGIPGGHSPRQLVPRFLPGSVRRFVTRILPGFYTRFSTRFVPRFLSQIYPGFAPGFYPEMVRRLSPRFLPRMVPRFYRRIYPRFSPRFHPGMVPRLLPRFLRRMVPQDLRQDSSPLFSPVFRPTRARLAAADFRPVCQRNLRLDTDRRVAIIDADGNRVFFCVARDSQRGRAHGP